MAEIIRFPAPYEVEEYLSGLFPDPYVRNGSENVQKFREILTHIFRAGISSPEETEWEDLRWYIHDKLLAIDEHEVIHGVHTIQVIASALQELQFPGANLE